MDQPSLEKQKKLPKRKGHTEELVDHYWGSINYVFGLIKASELKAGLILSFYGILLNFIYQKIGMVIAEASNHSFLYVLLTLCFIAMAASIFYSIKCFMPHIEAKFDKNIFFFGDVIKKYGNIKEFSKTFYEISLDEKELFDQLGQQIFVNSKIAAQKFKYVNRSIYFLAIGLFILFVLGVSYAVVTL